MCRIFLGNKIFISINVSIYMYAHNLHVTCLLLHSSNYSTINKFPNLNAHYLSTQLKY